jgi:GPH family glycoside/pentoside/hexuronide:cation symporter
VEPERGRPSRQTPSKTPSDPTLRAGVLAAYAAPALPVALLTLPVFVYLPPYYAETFGIPLAALGQALLAIRLIDAVSDPVAGLLIDRNPPWASRADGASGWGRRKAWIAAAILPCAIAAFFLFSPPDNAGLFYFTAWSIALSLSWTFAILPYQALGAELSGDYDRRSRITAAREGAIVLGTMLAAALPAVLTGMGRPEKDAVLTVIAYAAGFGLPLFGAWFLWRVPEPRAAIARAMPFRESLALMRRNGPFRRLIIAFLFNGFANALPAALFLFFVEYRLAAPASAGLLLLTYFLCGLASIPVWVWASARLGKHRAWCLAMIIACLGFAAVPALGAGAVTPFLIICIITGFMLGADLALPSAIQADVIDIDTAEIGGSRAGLYFAAWGLATKLSLALGAGVAFPVLAASGFDPGRDIVTPDGLIALALLYGALPIALKLIAVALMWNFPIGRIEQQALRAQIEARA